MWQKLERVQVKNKKESIDAFMKILKEVENGKYKFEEGSHDNGKYFIVNESGRHGSNFVHVVPKETYEIFNQMKSAMPDSFLGFSVLCGKMGGRDVRVSCFGIPTSDITRAMISKKE